jgi:hypothetical protein
MAREERSHGSPFVKRSFDSERMSEYTRSFSGLGYPWTLDPAVECLFKAEKKGIYEEA